jgi:hypothetical protein
LSSPCGAQPRAVQVLECRGLEGGRPGLPPAGLDPAGLEVRGQVLLPDPVGRLDPEGGQTAGQDRVADRVIGHVEPPADLLDAQCRLGVRAIVSVGWPRLIVHLMRSASPAGPRPCSAWDSRGDPDRRSRPPPALASRTRRHDRAVVSWARVAITRGAGAVRVVIHTAPPASSVVRIVPPISSSFYCSNPSFRRPGTASPRRMASRSDPDTDPAGH